MQCTLAYEPKHYSVPTTCIRRKLSKKSHHILSKWIVHKFEVSSYNLGWKDLHFFRGFISDKYLLPRTKFYAFKFLVKFIYSEKATKFCEIFNLLLTAIHTVKSNAKISQNFEAFSEYMNFIRSQPNIFYPSRKTKSNVKVGWLKVS